MAPDSTASRAPPHGIAPSPRKQSTRCPAAVQIGHSDSTSGSAHQPLQAGARSKMLKTSGQSMPRLSAPACTTSHTPTPTAAPAAKRGVANGVSVTNGTVTARDFMAAIARAESPDELLLALVQHARCADAMAVNALLSRLVKLHERRLLAMQARPAPPPNSGGTVAAAASAGPVASSPRPCVSTSTMPTLASKPQPAVNMASGAVQASYAYGHAAMQVDVMRTPPSPVQSQPSLSSSAPPGPMSWSEDVCLRLVRAALPVVARLVPSMQPRQAAGVMWSLARMPRAWLPPHGAGGGAGADASVTSVAAANIQSESHGSSAGSSTGAGCGCWAVSVLAGQLTEQLLRHQGVAKGQDVAQLLYGHARLGLSPPPPHQLEGLLAALATDLTRNMAMHRHPNPQPTQSQPAGQVASTTAPVPGSSRGDAGGMDKTAAGGGGGASSSSGVWSCMCPQALSLSLWALASMRVAPPRQWLDDTLQALTPPSGASLPPKPEPPPPPAPASTAPPAATASSRGGKGRTGSSTSDSDSGLPHPQALANTMWALSVLRCPPPPAWALAVQSASFPQLLAMSPRELVVLLYSTAQLYPAVQLRSRWLQRMCAALQAAAPAMSPQDVSNTAMALSLLGYSPGRGLADALIRRALHLKRQLSPEGLITVLCVLGRPGGSGGLGVSKQYMYEEGVGALAAIAGRRLGEFSPARLATLLPALLRAGHVPDGQWLERYLTRVAACLGRMAPGDLLAVLLALARGNLRPERRWLDRFLVELLARRAELSSGQLAIALWATARICAIPPTAATHGSSRAIRLHSKHSHHHHHHNHRHKSGGGQRGALAPTRAWLRAMTGDGPVGRCLPALRPHELAALLEGLATLRAAAGAPPQRPLLRLLWSRLADSCATATASTSAQPTGPSQPGLRLGLAPSRLAASLRSMAVLSGGTPSMPPPASDAAALDMYGLAQYTEQTFVSISSDDEDEDDYGGTGDMHSPAAARAGAGAGAGSAQPAVGLLGGSDVHRHQSYAEAMGIDMGIGPSSGAGTASPPARGSNECGDGADYARAALVQGATGTTAAQLHSAAVAGPDIMTPATTTATTTTITTTMATASFTWGLPPAYNTQRDPRRPRLGSTGAPPSMDMVVAQQHAQLQHLHALYCMLKGRSGPVLPPGGSDSMQQQLQQRHDAEGGSGSSGSGDDVGVGVDVDVPEAAAVAAELFVEHVYGLAALHLLR